MIYSAYMDFITYSGVGRVFKMLNIFPESLEVYDLEVCDYKPLWHKNMWNRIGSCIPFFYFDHCAELNDQKILIPNERLRAD